MWERKVVGDRFCKEKKTPDSQKAVFSSGLAFLHCLPVTSSNSHCWGQRAGEDGNPPGAPAVLSSQWSLTNQVGKNH